MHSSLPPSNKDERVEWDTKRSQVLPIASKMSRVCYTLTRTSTSYSTTTVKLSTFRNSVSTLRPTGTRVVGKCIRLSIAELCCNRFPGQVTTFRVPYVTTYHSYIPRKTTYHTTSCTTVLPNGATGAPSGVQVPTGLIVGAAIAGLWAVAMLAAVIYVLW